jgi:hypothetical protein
VALRVAREVLAEHGDVLAAEACELAGAALRAAPAADAWASRFIERIGPVRPPTMTVRQCRDVVTGAVDGIAWACIGDADDRLVALLTDAVSDTARFVGAREADDIPPAMAKTSPERRDHTPLRRLGLLGREHGDRAGGLARDAEGLVNEGAAAPPLVLLGPDADAVAAAGLIELDHACP